MTSWPPQEACKTKGPTWQDQDTGAPLRAFDLVQVKSAGPTEACMVVLWPPEDRVGA